MWNNHTHTIIGISERIIWCNGICRTNILSGSVWKWIIQYIFFILFSIVGQPQVSEQVPWLVAISTGSDDQFPGYCCGSSAIYWVWCAMVHATISHYVPSCLHMTAIQIDKWVIAICGHSIIQVNSAMSIKSILLGISQVIRLNIQEDHKWWF